MVSVKQIDRFLELWRMDARDLHRRLIWRRRPRSKNVGTPSGCWFKAGQLRVRRASERDPHTIGRWAAAFGEGGPAALIFEQSGAPPPLMRRSRRS